jgi:hypothetical protein
MLLRTAPWLLVYTLSVPIIFLISPFLIVANLLALMILSYQFYLLCSELYVICHDMVLVSTGLVNKTVTWLEPLNIKEFELHQTGLMRRLNLFHVTITSAEDLDVKFTLRGIEICPLIEALRRVIEILEVRQEYSKLLTKTEELLKLLEDKYGCT